jgi:hypothetical protein
MTTPGTPSSSSASAVASDVSDISGNPKIAGAIAIKDIIVETVEYGDYSPSSLPELPFGLYYQPTDSAPTERLRSYTFAKDIDKGSYSRLLSQLQEKKRLAPERIVVIASNFFAKAIEKIGSYSLTDIAKRYGTTPSVVIERLYMADVITLIFAARLAVVGSNAGYSEDLEPDDLPRTPFDYAVDTTCGCDDAKQVKIDPRKSEECSLRKIEIKLYQNPSKPVFEVPLPRGFSDGDSTIRKVYMEPLKWFQLAAVMSKEGDSASDLRLLMAMIIAVPESKIYGVSKNAHPFCKELYDPMTKADISALRTAMGKLQFGPKTQQKISCYFCDKDFEAQLPWVVMAYFIYSSDEITES